MKKHLATLFFLFIALGSMANNTVTASETTNVTDATTASTPKYAYHLGTMWDVSVGKDFGFMRTTFQQSVFTLDTELERAMSILIFDVPIINRYLHFNGLGFYLYYRMGKDNYRHLLRYHAGLSGSVPFNYLSLAWSGRYESTYVLGNDGPINKVRARVRLVGNIPDSKVQPYIGSEFFLVANGANAGRGERLWYDIGISYKIDKTNTVEFLIREEQLMLTTPKQWNTHIGVAYKINL